MRLFYVKTQPNSYFVTKDRFHVVISKLFSMCTVAQLSLVIFGDDQTTIIQLNDITQLLKIVQI